MTSINLLKVASLPGSGSGCQSALPAEVGKAAGKATDPLDAWFQPIARSSDTVTVNIITGTTTTTAQALQIAEQIMRARNREARPKSYVEGGFVLGDPIPARRVLLYGEAIIPASSPDLLDAAGGGE